jgi:hypothetical protein
MGRNRQGNLAVAGMEGPDPELDRLARVALDARDAAAKAQAEAAQAKDKVKAKMEETGDAAITVEGVVFKISLSKKLTLKGERTRDEE